MTGPERDQVAVDIPVVIILYNRALMIQQLLDTLREIQPSHLLIVADGPKDGDARDQEAVRATRRELESIDWPCVVETDISQTNLGCTRRVRSGLDWAFERVDRAIILEDDINPVAEFFGWASTVLRLYENRDDIAMVCGHNPLVRWKEWGEGSAVIPSHRGAVSGWATTAKKWLTVRNVRLPVSMGESDRVLDRAEFEPTLRQLYSSYIGMAWRGGLSWDVDWTLKMALSGRSALVAPANMIHHLGVGPSATHHRDSNDTLFTLPRPKLDWAPRLTEVPSGSNDQTFDRFRVLLELLVRTKNPAMAERMSRSPSLPLGEQYRTHLLPFMHKEDSRCALRHLVEHGVAQDRLQHWIGALTPPTDQGRET